MAVQGAEAAAQLLIRAEGQSRQMAPLMLQPDSPSGSLFADSQVPDNGSDAGEMQPVTPRTPATRVMRSTKSRWAWGLAQDGLKRRAAGLLHVVSCFVETVIQLLHNSQPSSGKSCSKLPVHDASMCRATGAGRLGVIIRQVHHIKRV